MRHVFAEQLESRQLLSFSVGNLVSDNLAAAEQVDPAAARADLIRFADTWNGGQQGKLGTAGMGAYASNWSGLFWTNLDRRFNRINAYTIDQTIIAQSRAIYLNVEA